VVEIGKGGFKTEGHKMNGVQQELPVCRLSMLFTVGYKLI